MTYNRRVSAERPAAVILPIRELNCDCISSTDAHAPGVDDCCDTKSSYSTGFDGVAASAAAAICNCASTACFTQSTCGGLCCAAAAARRARFVDADRRGCPIEGVLDGSLLSSSSEMSSDDESDSLAAADGAGRDDATAAPFAFFADDGSGGLADATRL